ncbi:MAG: DUF4412 domain-containing protein [Aquaticitalea sp.]
MKNYKFSLVLLVFSLFSIPNCQAQFLEKLQKRAEKRAQQRVENKIEKQVDKTVDRTVDAPENAVKENKKNKKTDKESASETKNQQPLDFSSLMNGSPDLELPDSYMFKQKVTYIIEGPDSKQTHEMTYWFGDDEAVFGIEPGYDSNSIIVYDMAQDAMLMFSQKEKNVQVIPFGMFGSIYDNSSDDDTDFIFKDTEETKKINGYTCQKYLMTSANMEGEFWFTKNIDLKIPSFSKAFLSVSKTSNQKVPDIDQSAHGFMMEMKTKDKTSKTLTQMTVKEITPYTYNIKTTDYKRAGM